MRKGRFSSSSTRGSTSIRKSRGQRRSQKPGRKDSFTGNDNHTRSSENKGDEKQVSHQDSPREEEAESEDDDYGDDEFEDDFAEDFDDTGFEEDVKATQKDYTSSDEPTFDSQNFQAPPIRPPAQRYQNQKLQQKPKTKEWLIERVYVPKRIMSPQQKKDARRQARRVESILTDVELSFETFELLRRDPEPPWAMHIKGIARGIIKDSSCQYNEDWRSVKVQTDPPQVHSIGTQHPDFQGSTITEASTARLPDFVFRASQLIETLIMENNQSLGVWASGGAEGTQDPSSLFAPGELKLSIPKLLGSRHVVALHFSSTDPNLLLAAYSKDVISDGKKTVPSKTSTTKKVKLHTYTQEEWLAEVLPRKSLLCVWRLNQPHTPAKILYCDGEPLCCGLSPRGYIAYAGMREGSIALWDLREKPMLHRTIRTESVLFIMRHPSYSTANWIGENHLFAVHKIILLSAAAMRDFRGKSKIDNHSSFQIATLDESGSTNIWTVAELQTGSLAGSETDFGLNIGSRVKLIKTKTISKSETLRTCSAVDLECHPQDASELLVALSNGVVSRWRRFGSQPTPSNYVTLDEGSYATSFDEKSSDWALHWELIDRETTNTKMKSRISGRSPSRKSTTIGVEIMSPSPSPFYAQKDACTCISVSPFVPDYFLVAYQSGHVNLFATLQGTPIKTWAPFGGESISKIRWSNFRPAVFYALDISGVLHCFDLTTSEQYPITAAQLDGSVFDLSCNSSSYTHKSSRAKSVLAHSDCQTANITVCRFNQHFTSCMENELREVRNMLSHFG